MSARFLSIGTAVPAARLDRSETRDLFVSQPGVDRLTARLIGTVFDHSAIDSRYSVIGPPGARSPVLADENEVLRAPSTGARNAVYRSEAPELYAAAARAAIAEAGIEAADITHVITVSCTGFFAPGPDFLLVRDLGIPPTAERTHIGFMGCAAAFPALRAAAHTCEAVEGAVVLVVCAELCSIHIRISSDPEQIVASAVFGDGAAPSTGVDGWAVHPGRRSVLDKVEAGLGLDRSALAHSRAVLRDYGNMSSATILFTLRRMLHGDSLVDGSRVVGLCFGPGLTVETALFTRRAPAVPQEGSAA